MMLSKHYLISIICLVVVLQSSPSLAVDAEPIGWATLAGGTTGGQGGQVVTVTNKAEFVSAVSGDTPRIVQVVGTIHGDYNIPSVGSNKTILGIGYDAEIVGFSVKVSDLDNVIVRNITFHGAMPQDGLICRRATHLWIDHCTFFDSADGLCDFSDQCDYVTVSWCRFYYTGKINDHRLACLVGSTDDNSVDVGKLNVTFHHNWWGNYVDQRMPRVRYGQNHMFNNYYSCTGNYYCIGGSWGFKGLVENNYFDHVNNPINDAGVTNTGVDGITYTVQIKSVGNIFNVCTGSTSSTGSAFVPAYTYTLDAAASIPSIVKGGAGTTILVGDSALWPTKATVPSPINGDGNAAVASILSWCAGSTAVSHNVYFGTSPTGLVSCGSQTATSFTPPTLTADTEYYWRIDEVAGDESVIIGDLWTFKTIGGLSANLYHYWPFDVDFLDVARVFTSNPNNPFGAAWLDTSTKLLGGGCLDLTYQKDGLIAGWSDSSTNTIFPTTAPMTISLWFKPTALPASDKTACMLGSKIGAETAAKTFRIELLPTGICRLTIDSDVPEFGNLPVLNGWNHVLVSINSSGQMRAWLNANEAGSITLTTIASNNYNGQYTGIGFYGDEPGVNAMSRGEYTGYIDDVAIWKVSSDLMFAESLYNNGVGRMVIRPVFTSDPINLDAVELSPYAGPSLVSYASDVNYDGLTFSKVSGPKWLSVTPDGTLSGSPGNTDVGVNTFTVRVADNGGLYDTAVMNITVANIYSGVAGLDDIIGLASQWLTEDCTDMPTCSGADLDDDADVDLDDFAALAFNWLSPEDLQLHLKLDETAGTTAADSSLYGRSGNLINGPTWSTEGKFDGALSFDGTDDYVEISDYYGISGASSRTVGLWIKTTLAGKTQELLQWGSNASGQLWLVRLQADGTILVAAYGGGVMSTATVTDGQWHHIATVLDEGQTDSNSIRLYVDGQLDTATLSVSCVINTVPATPLYLGVWEWYSTGYKANYFQGLMDDVRIYDAALSEQEIHALSQ